MVWEMKYVDNMYDLHIMNSTFVLCGRKAQNCQIILSVWTT
jgi:hypothetical protein